MKWLLFKSAVAACLLPLLSTGLANADLVITGELQTEQGDPSDWAPDTSSLIMTDNGGGIYTSTANNLLDGTLYKFKVLDDEGTPPAVWGDPEIVNVDTMAYGDADGSVDIYVDTNQTNGNGGAVTWVNTDNAPLQVVGNFMVAAGGASDWNPTDLSFAMTPEGNGYYSIDLVISSPGDYDFKATDGTGWDYQVGVDGLGNNAGSFGFSTIVPDQPVTMYIDLAGQGIGVATIPEPTPIVMFLSATVLGALRRRR